MCLDEPGAVGRIRIDKRHSIVAPLVGHCVSIQSGLTLRKPELSHDEDCAVDVLSCGHTFSFQRAVNGHHPGERDILRRIDGEIIFVNRLHLSVTYQRQIDKIRVQKNLCHIE